MWKSKPLLLLSLLILPILISACGGSSADGVANAEGYLEDVANGDIVAAHEHVCEIHESDVDRIVARTSIFSGERGTFDMHDISCRESGHFVECNYTLSATVYGRERHDDGTIQQVILNEDSRTISETYRIDDNLVCGVVASTISGGVSEVADVNEADMSEDNTSSTEDTTNSE